MKIILYIMDAEFMLDLDDESNVIDVNAEVAEIDTGIPEGTIISSNKDLEEFSSSFTEDPKIESFYENLNKALASKTTVGVQTVERVEEGLNNLLETSTQTELAFGPEGSLPLRELAGLDRSLRNMRTTVLHLIGEREVRKARLQELKEETSSVAYKEGEVQFDENLREKLKEINSLKDQIEGFDSVIREYDGKFRSQFQRIKRTIDKMRNIDMTLGEKIKTLFREQGITIASILGAIAFGITALGTSIALGIKNATPNPKPDPKPGPKPGPKPDPGPEPGPEPPTPGSKSWIKEMLGKIKNILIKLGDKALSLLPGLIGAAVNFLLKYAAVAVGFVAENEWTLILAAGALVYYELRRYLRLQVPN